MMCALMAELGEEPITTLAQQVLTEGTAETPKVKPGQVFLDRATAQLSEHQQSRLWPPKEALQKYAKRLDETSYEATQKIANVVTLLGFERVDKLIDEAAAIFAGEGMLVADGSRKRTLGGVFFALCKQQFRPRDWPKLMGALPPFAKAKKDVPAPIPTITLGPISANIQFDWESRDEVIKSLVFSEARKVKITLTGRPENVVDKGSSVVFGMQDRKVPDLPKGLPIPPASASKYVVYVTAKQWKKVSPALADPEDILIIEGWCQLDIQTKCIAVFATNATSRALQATQKVKQQEASQAAAVKS